MTKVIAVNGSPRVDQGSTAMVLGAFIRGMEAAGAQVRTVYPSRLKMHPCDCSEMRCWFTHPGECYHRDDMSGMCRLLRETEVVVLATPVYVPLPGDMQHFINRLCPLMDPHLVFKDGRTRVRLRDDVSIKRFAVLSTGGWWEKENFDTVVRIVRGLAAGTGAVFAGAVLRPHVDVMKSAEGMQMAGGAEVLEAVEKAGRELIGEGAMQQATLDAISRPLISREAYLSFWNSRLSAGGG